MFLNERRQSENAIYYMIPTIWHSEKDKTMKTVKRLVVATGQEGCIGRGQRNCRQWNYSACTLLCVINTCHYTLVQIHRMYKSKS